MLSFMMSLPLSAKTGTPENRFNLRGTQTNGIVTYTIKDSYNLNGDTLLLPHNSNLAFTSGRFTNGTIIGDGTSVSASNVLIFKNVNISGTWSNEKVYGNWVNFPKKGKPCNKAFQNLMTLCKGDKLTHFYLNKGVFYVSAINESAPIIVPSNVYWHNKAEIRMLPTDLSKYSTVLLDRCDNVTIDGGTFVGDVRTHIGDKGEWGHGIKCNGTTNVCLKNMTCSYHWGDGIDLIEGYYANRAGHINCDGVDISSVKCLYNRRQGMSIEAAINVTVSNSEFAYTGYPEFTSPGAGVDIEPWCDNEIKIRNISIDECNFHDNKGPDLFMMLRYNKNQGKEVSSDISVNRCHIGTFRFLDATGIKVSDCIIDKLIRIKDSNNIEFYKSEIPKIDREGGDRNIRFNNCINRN